MPAPEGQGRAVVIAVDGPAAAGKGTLARRLAAHYGLRYLDSGALYRAVAAKLLRGGIPFEDRARAAAAARTLRPEELDDPALRGEEVARGASIVAAMPEVRAALLSFQRDFAARPPGAVVDGRDIGTVVFPEASAKIFLDASPEVRAKRRLLELRERGEKPIDSRVLAEMVERDARDRARTVAPLRPAPDALVIDTSDLDADAVFARARAFVDERLGAR